jgi:hypothetical protein
VVQVLTISPPLTAEICPPVMPELQSLTVPPSATREPPPVWFRFAHGAHDGVVDLGAAVELESSRGDVGGHQAVVGEVGVDAAGAPDGVSRGVGEDLAPTVVDDESGVRIPGVGVEDEGARALQIDIAGEGPQERGDVAAGGVDGHRSVVGERRDQAHLGPEEDLHGPGHGDAVVVGAAPVDQEPAVDRGEAAGVDAG